jgi:predicted DNA-binding transcriptional regulator YafY
VKIGFTFGRENIAIKGKGGENMQATTERRQAILEAMCDRRHESVTNLAFEFGVTTRTIKTDLQILACSYPIYTTQGNGGGVHVVDGFYLGRKYLKPNQKALLELLAEGLAEEDAKTMGEILKTFALKNKEEV